MSGLQYLDPIRAATGGTIYAGALLSVFESDGETRAAIFADAQRQAPLSNPLEANAAGRFPAVYVALGATYRVLVTDADENSIIDQSLSPALLPLAISDAQPLDDNGAALPNAQRIFYAAQTTTLVPVWADEALTIDLDNPVEADENGDFVPVFVDPDLAYRVILNDGVGRLIYDVGQYLIDPASVPPSAPTLSGVLNGGATAIDLSWTAATSQFGTVAGYRLYNADTDALIIDQATRVHSFSPVSPGNSYRFYVIAYDAEGLVSARSNVVVISIDPTVLLVDLDSILNAATSTAGAAAKGVTLSGFAPGDVLTITPNTDGAAPFIAWSPWGVPSPVGFHQGSVYKFNVIKDAVPASNLTFQNVAGAVLNGYLAARAAFIADFPAGVTVTGASSYTFWIFDSPIADNTGGVSLRIVVT